MQLLPFDPVTIHHSPNCAKQTATERSHKGKNKRSLRKQQKGGNNQYHERGESDHDVERRTEEQH